MKNTKTILVVIVLFTIACMCGSTPGTQPVKVGEASEANPTAVPSYEIYSVGDIINTGQTNITLNKAEFRGNVLYANFTVENISNEEITISSILLFEAKSDDGTKLEQEIFDCETGLDGSILPGDKLRGSICWTGATSTHAKIYYSPFLSDQTVVWEVTE